MSLKLLTAFTTTIVCAFWQRTAAIQRVFKTQSQDEYYLERLWNATFTDKVNQLVKGKPEIAAQIGRNNVRFVNPTNGKPLSRVQLNSVIKSLDFTNDSSTLIVGTSTRLFLVKSEAAKWNITGISAADKGWVKVSPNADKCYYSKEGTTQIEVYSTVNWKKTRVLRASDKVYGAADVCGQKLAQPLTKGNIAVFNTTNGTELHTIPGTNDILQLSFSSDCSKLVAVGRGNKVRLIEASNGWDTIWENATQHTQAVTSICWLTADTFTTVAWDNSIVVWSVGSNTSLTVERNAHTDWIRSVVCDSNDTLITGSRDKTVAKWRVVKLTETSTATPTVNPTASVTLKPTARVTPKPTESGTANPTVNPTANPSVVSFAPNQSQRVASAMPTVNSAQTAVLHSATLLLATALLLFLH